MTLPIVALGNKILRETCQAIEEIDSQTTTLIENMFTSMDESDGVGLAAPQINYSINLFVVNTIKVFDQISEEEQKKIFPEEKGIKATFINAKITNHSLKKWSDYEGCLSIPGINELVERNWEVTIEYQDENLIHKTKKFTGYNAKVIQHEYDHTQGILFIDKISPLKKRLIRNKLRKITTGKVKTNYPILFKM